MRGIRAVLFAVGCPATVRNVLTYCSSDLPDVGLAAADLFEVYRASKSALNQLMRSYAARHRGETRALLLIAPGWVQTGLGGPGAHLTVEDSVTGVVDTIEADHAIGELRFVDCKNQLQRDLA
jgi:NAD(P)-dependent dehydrogenase (short-subunit alcohol dehydrogenase family)